MRFSPEFKNEPRDEARETQVGTAVLQRRLVSPTQGFSLPERLAEAAKCLEKLDQERACCGDPTLGQSAEERIVWRELLDLELQDFDEEVARRSDLARRFLTREMTAAIRMRSNRSSRGGLSQVLSLFDPEACSSQPCRSAS
jgi:hypothetical protein